METTSGNTKRKFYRKAAITVIVVLLSYALFAFAVAFSRYPETALIDLRLGSWMKAITSLLALILVTALVWFFRSVLGKGSLASLGISLIPGWLLHLLGGAAVGLGLFSLFIAVQYALGLVKFTGTLWQVMENGAIPSYLFIGLVRFIVVGINEELYFRGYLYTMLKERHNRTLAVLVSILLFSLIHGLEAGFVSLVFVNILLIGAIFVLLRERTGSLWLPIGLHWMWDYAQFYVLAVSTPEVDGRGLLSFFQAEGVYGPEGTPAATIIFGLLFIFLVYDRLRSGRQSERNQEIQVHA